MGCEGGFILYDIANAATQFDKWRQIAADYLRPVFDRQAILLDKYVRLSKDRPNERKFWLDSIEDHEKEVAALAAAIQTGDMLTILRAVIYPPSLSDWGEMWWGKAAEQPVRRHIVRISYGTNVSEDVDAVLRMMDALRDAGVVTELEREETWT